MSSNPSSRPTTPRRTSTRRLKGHLQPCVHCRKMYDEEHVARCSLRPVKCTNCGEVMRAFDLLDHMEHRVCHRQCPHCLGWLKGEKELLKHLGRCGKRPTLCPACMTPMTLRELVMHRRRGKGMCPNRVVDVGFIDDVGDGKSRRKGAAVPNGHTNDNGGANHHPHSLEMVVGEEALEDTRSHLPHVAAIDPVLDENGCDEVDLRDDDDFNDDNVHMLDATKETYDDRNVTLVLPQGPVVDFSSQSSTPRGGGGAVHSPTKSNSVFAITRLPDEDEDGGGNIPSSIRNKQGPQFPENKHHSLTSNVSTRGSGGPYFFPHLNSPNCRDDDTETNLSIHYPAIHMPSPTMSSTLRNTQVVMMHSPAASMPDDDTYLHDDDDGTVSFSAQHFVLTERARPNDAKEVAEFLTQMLGDGLVDKNNLCKSLGSGELLCRLVGTPLATQRVTVYSARANVALFIDVAIRTFQNTPRPIAARDLFDVSDLVGEKRNEKNVVSGLRSFMLSYRAAEGAKIKKKK
eukprot:PhM_4_TR16695/c0_g1_i1/m.40245